MPPQPHATHSSCAGGQPEASQAGGMAASSERSQVPISKSQPVSMLVSEAAWNRAGAHQAATGVSICVWISRQPRIQRIWETHAGCYQGLPLVNTSPWLSEPSLWLLRPCDPILSAQADHFISYCSPLLQLSQFLTIPLNSGPAFSAIQIMLLLTWVCHFLSLSPTSHRNAFFSPLILAQFSPRLTFLLPLKKKLSEHLDHPKTPVSLVFSTTWVSI